MFRKQEVFIWVGGVVALSLVAGLLIAAASHAPLLTIIVVMCAAGIAMMGWGVRLGRRERHDEQASQANWNRYLDSALSDESIAWATTTWGKRYRDEAE